MKSEASRGHGRVLIASPTTDLAAPAGKLLDQAGITSSVLANPEDLATCPLDDVGALLLPGESLTQPAAASLARRMRGQPAWSDLPVIIITGEQESQIDTTGLPANLLFVRRPLRAQELVGTVRTALAACLRGQTASQCNVHPAMAPRRSDAALRRSAARFDGIITSAMDAIVSIDSQQRIVLFNPAAEKMFGVSAGEVVGQNLSRLIPQRFREAHTTHVEGFGKTGVSARRVGALGTISGLRADGEEFPIEAAISQVGVGVDKLFTVILRDITERKRAEEALRQGQERLQAANRELTDFATIVSHDLKAPLRAVATLATWLQSDYADKLDDEGRENLAEIGNRVRRMDWMIDGILEYSLIGRTKDNPEPVALADLVSGVVQDLAPPEHAYVHVAPDLPVVQGEPVRLRQVFQNLIANSLKYGDKPRIEVHVEWTDQGSFWEFRVADNGPGIEPRHFERIFGMFQTLAPKDKTDSTGVGLALVRRVVERAGGRVWVESRLGEGSTFHFTWPKAPPASAGGEVTTVVRRHEPFELQPSPANPSGWRS